MLKELWFCKVRRSGQKWIVYIGYNISIIVFEPGDIYMITCLKRYLRASSKSKISKARDIQGSS